MTTIVFLLTILAMVILVTTIFSRMIRRRPIKRSLIVLLSIVAFYSLMWAVFFILRADKPIPLGTDVCFDDWCATVTAADTASTLGAGPELIHPAGSFVILHLRMSNHARGIAQKPSEPRVHILDANGHIISFSPLGQAALEHLKGPQVTLDSRLELHQSIETQLVFDVPKNATGLKALIEEGPAYINDMLWHGEREIFKID